MIGDEGTPMELRIREDTIEVVCMVCGDRLTAGRNPQGTAATNSWAWAHECPRPRRLSGSVLRGEIVPERKEISGAQDS